MLRSVVAVAAVLALGAVAGAQERHFYYPAPAPSSFTLLADQPYGDLRMDVYRPRDAAAPAPVLILFNTVSGAERAASVLQGLGRDRRRRRGLVAILPDLRVATLEQDFDALLAHLTANAASLGADRDRIAVYAGSGNVFRGLPLFVDPRRTALKAAVLYYGSADVKTFRGDLPTLFVRAGLDRPPVNRAMTDLITLAQTQNVPVTVVNYPGGHHAFEMFDDEPATRDVIDDARSTSSPAARRPPIRRRSAAAFRKPPPPRTSRPASSRPRPSVYARLVTAQPRRRQAAPVLRRSAPRRLAVRRRLRRVRAPEGQGAGAARPRPAGRARVRAEGRRRGGDRLARVHPGALPAGGRRERARLRADPRARRLQGAVRGGTLDDRRAGRAARYGRSA